MTLGLALAALLAAAPQPAIFRGYEAREAPTGPVYSRGWTEQELRWVEGFLPETLREVEELLGRARGRPFTTVFVNGWRELDRIVSDLGGGSPEPYTLGVAVPRRDVLIVRTDVPVTGPGQTVRGTIRHEVSHLVTHRNRAVGPPRWLDEGLAEWAAGRVLTAKEESYLVFLARTDSLYRLKSLETAFPRGHAKSSVAYQQSLLLVEFLEERYGRVGIHRLLDLLEQGRGAEDALRDLTGRSPRALEAAFSGWLAARMSFLQVLLYMGNVWTLVAILSLLAIGRHIVKKRRLFRKLEEESSDASAAGEDG